MKIICTKQEKANILRALGEADICPFEENFGLICNPGHCEFCCEDHIEWELKDGGKDV